MRIENTFDATLLSVITTPSKDGTKNYHKLGIMLPTSEVGMISASEECVEAIAQNKLNTPCLVKVKAEFNDQYETYRAVGLSAIK